MILHFPFSLSVFYWDTAVTLPMMFPLLSWSEDIDCREEMFFCFFFSPFFFSPFFFFRNVLTVPVLGEPSSSWLALELQPSNDCWFKSCPAQCFLPSLHSSTSPGLLQLLPLELRVTVLSLGCETTTY